jgi:hypothetical protein
MSNIHEGYFAHVVREKSSYPYCSAAAGWKFHKNKLFFSALNLRYSSEVQFFNLSHVNIFFAWLKEK